MSLRALPGRRAAATLAGMLIALVAVPAAATVAPDWLEDGDAAFGHLVERQAGDFDAVLAQFDDAIAREPDRARLAMARCDFLWRVWDIEGVDWTERAPDLHATCIKSLRERWPQDPDVHLFALDQDYGEDGDALAKSLWEEFPQWPTEHRGRLAHRLAVASTGRESGEYALQAVELGHWESLPRAIRHLGRGGKTGPALALADSAALATTRSQLDARLEALLELKDASAAASHLARHQGLQFKASPDVAARVLMRAGELDAAGAVLADAGKDLAKGKSSRALADARVELALALGDGREAASHFNFDFDRFTEVQGTFFRIAHASPLMMFHPNLLPGTLAWLLIVMLFLALPLVVLVPVHYVGMFRRQTGKVAPALFPRVGLRHAWFALAVPLILAPMVALAIASPELLSGVLSGEVDANVFEVLYWSTLAGLATMAPLLFWMRREAWTGSATDLPGMLPRVLGCYALAFSVGMAIAWVEHLMRQSGIEMGGSGFDEALAKSARGHGLLLSLLVMAVLVPIFEEWLFRGVLLGAFTRHIGFAGANLLQATLFMFIHDDVTRFPFYFAVGVLAGWLVRRYGYLLPAILLHMVNNAVATWLGST